MAEGCILRLTLVNLFPYKNAAIFNNNDSNYCETMNAFLMVGMINKDDVWSNQILPGAKFKVKQAKFLDFLQDYGRLLHF